MFSVPCAMLLAGTLLFKLSKYYGQSGQFKVKVVVLTVKKMLLKRRKRSKVKVQVPVQPT